MSKEYQEWLNNHKKNYGDISAKPEHFGILVWDAARSAEQRNRAASTNSDYATAVAEILTECEPIFSKGFDRFTSEVLDRLNAEEPHSG